MYAQNSILCQFGNSEICPNFANPYLTQFSSISGGNCIRHSRPHFATHIPDHVSRPMFHDSRSRLPFATPISDSRPRLPIAPPTATHYFLSRLPSCDSTTDGRTVLTPQRHLPSVPTLTLTKKFWNLLPGLASPSSYYPSSCPPPLMALCLLTHPLSPYLLQRPLPPCQGSCQHSHLYYPLCPSLHSSCMGTCH